MAIIPFRILRKRSIGMGALVLFSLGMSSQTVGTPTPFHATDVVYEFLIYIVCVLPATLLPVCPRGFNHG